MTAPVAALGLPSELLWLMALTLDLTAAIVLYRLFGRFGLYASVSFAIMLANTQGPALTEIFGMKTSLGNILYSGIYFSTDLLSEKYGRAAATRAVMLGFAVSLLTLVFTQIGLAFPPAASADIAEHTSRAYQALQQIFGFYPKIVMGSMLAYLVTQNLDVWIFHWLKQALGGRHLWLRNNASTMLSQAVDTLLFSVVVWGPLFSWELVLELAVSKYLFKIFIAAFDTPFIYWVRTWRRPEERFAEQQAMSGRGD